LAILSGIAQHLALHSFPTRRSSDLVTVPAVSPSRLRAVTDLPEPDSPTIPSALPGVRVNETLRTASIGSVARPGNVTDKFVTSIDRKSTRLNSSHVSISYADLCLKK